MKSVHLLETQQRSGEGSCERANGASFLQAAALRLAGDGRALFNNPACAYTLIFLLQLKVISSIWWLKDLTSGDTSSYFCDALNWCEKGMGHIAWSPLYTLFAGGCYALTHDAFLACIVHRACLVLVLSVMVLFLMRRLLPASLAWFAAAWWVINPINFNTLYEVHLFALLPVLVSWIILLAGNSAWNRGIALAVLAGSVVLVRNEQLLTAVPLMACMVAYELTKTRDQRASVLAAYLLPAGLCALTVAFFYAHSRVQLPGLLYGLKAKHTQNVGQIFAFGFQQRHPSWTASPWSEYNSLELKVFGSKEVQLWEAVARNPAAMAEHFQWNASLIPDGLQVLLFNRMSGSVNPDYAPVKREPITAALLSLLALSVWALALGKINSAKRELRVHWLPSRAWGLLAMGLSIMTSVFVMLMQRPRPSYLFSLELILIASLGFASWLLLRKTAASRALEKCAPIGMLAAIVLIPPYHFNDNQDKSRPLLHSYRLLKPHAREMRKDPGTLIAPGYADELVNYLTGHSNWKTVNLYHLPAGRASSPELLQSVDAKLILLDDYWYDDKAGWRHFLERDSHGWKLDSQLKYGTNTLRLFTRAPKALPSAGRAQEAQWTCLRTRRRIEPGDPLGSVTPASSESMQCRPGTTGACPRTDATHKALITGPVGQ